jgi:peptide/nickel transport system permease protein
MLALVPLLLGVILLVFVLMQLSGTDPAMAAFEGANPTPQQIAAFRHANGLDLPLPVRYVRFVWGLLHGGFGDSVLTHRPVAESILAAWPLTAQLALFGLVIALAVSLPLGIISALFRDRWPDQVIRMVSLGSVTAPSFWVALLLIQWLAVDQGLLPTGGYISPSDDVIGWLQSLVLPTVTLAIPIAGQMTRIIRASVIEELDLDYVRTARGGGLPPFVVVARNVLRNALVTPLTVLGLRVGYLLGGTVVIETVFSLPGMGLNLIQAVENGDTAVVQGFVIIIALGFTVINLLIDILYLIANPRLRSNR